MVITILALRAQFEADYLAELGKMDNHIKQFPEEARKSFFRRRIRGDYEMSMVENGWNCYQLGAKAGVEIHGKQEERPPASPEQTNE